MEKKYSEGSLLQFQSLPLSAKLNITERRINQWFNHYNGKVYLAFSGGKASTVLKDIIKKMGLKIPSVFVNTGVEYPEIVKFVREQQDVTIIRPKMGFKQIIEKYGYPVVSKEQSAYIREYRNTKNEKVKERRLNGNADGKFKISKKWQFLIDAPFKISEMCCNVLKKEPSLRYEKESGNAPILATLAEESNLRRVNWYKYGCNAFEKTRPTSQPLSIWTEQDILEYIYENKIKLASVYGDVIKDENGKFKLTGLSRTGCITCLYGLHHHDNIKRFEYLKENHNQLYRMLTERLMYNDVIKFVYKDKIEI